MGLISLHVVGQPLGLLVRKPAEVEAGKFYAIILEGGKNGPFTVSRLVNGTVEVAVPAGLSMQQIESFVEFPTPDGITATGGRGIKHPTAAQAFEFLKSHQDEDLVIRYGA